MNSVSLPKVRLSCKEGVPIALYPIRDRVRPRSLAYVRRGPRGDLSERLNKFKAINLGLASELMVVRNAHEGSSDSDLGGYSTKRLF